MKKIEGSIKYEITVDGNDWKLTYEQNSENDLATLAIGQKLMEWSEAEFTEALNNPEHTTKARMFLKKRLEKVRAAKFGLQIMCESLLLVFDTYKAFVEHNKNSAGPQLSPEQQAELEKMRKDLTKLHQEGKL